MNIVITYCVSWTYLPRAAGLAAEIRKALGVEAVLAQGAGGVFDVTCDGEVVFSRHRARRFPERGEVVQAIKTLRGG